MANIDKVIEGLVQISNFFFDAYRKETNVFDYTEAKNKCDIVEDALVLLKEQEPVAPYVGAEGITINCGNCGETVGYYPAGSSVPDKKCVYCPECGRKIKWND